jgi:hypothetical protein
MIHLNPISLVKNSLGIAEGIFTGNPVKLAVSSVKLCKSFVPFADIIPGLDEVVEGAFGELMDAASGSVVDVISGTELGEVVHGIGENMYHFSRIAHADGILDMTDSDNDGYPDLKGALHTLAFASGYPISAFPTIDLGS